MDIKKCSVCGTGLLKKEAEKETWLYCPKCTCVYDVQRKTKKK